MIDKKKTVCFTGHRQIDIKKLENLSSEIEKAVSMGYDTFLSGGAIGFDQYAALSVLHLKNKYPNIKLIFVLPCNIEIMSKKWNYDQKKHLYTLCDKADNVIYISDNYYEGCMRKRNETLVELSSYCIAYLEKERSGTGQTVRLMKKKNGHIVIL